jgi:hypothetical protein
VRGNHADQAALLVGQRRRLHRPETRRSGDLPVWLETPVGEHVGDDQLRVAPGRAPARRPAISDFLEVIKEPLVEPMLRNNPQRARIRVRELNVAAVGARERQYLSST